jgi:predicted transcriptional regulator
MSRISAEKIEKLIAKAEQAGVPDDELQELREYLAQIKSAKMMTEVKIEPMYLSGKEKGLSVYQLVQCLQMIISLTAYPLNL